MIGAGELTDLNSPEFMAAFAEEQQLPTVLIPTMLPSWSRLMRDEGGGLGLAPGRVYVIRANPGKRTEQVGVA